MTNPDFTIYAVHGAFWCSFGITRFLTPPENSGSAEVGEPLASAGEKTAPFSRSLVFVHAAAFFVMYGGMALAIMPNRVPVWFPGQRVAGTLIIVLGAGLVSWAVANFSSWRFQAKLDRGHELATQGPFRMMRHPIYMGMNLLALGTAIWIPSKLVWLSVVLMVIGGDMRARAEEKILETAFGDRYRHYFANTKRFVPGVY